MVNLEIVTKWGEILGGLAVITGIIIVATINILMRKKEELIVLQKLSAEDARTYFENIQKKSRRFWMIFSGICVLLLLLLSICH